MKAEAQRSSKPKEKDVAENLIQSLNEMSRHKFETVFLSGPKLK